MAPGIADRANRGNKIRAGKSSMSAFSSRGRRTMRNLLNDCQRIEEIMGEVYRKLAGVESYSDRLRSIFGRLARDEEDHARQLEMFKGVPWELFVAEVTAAPARVDALLRRAAQLLRQTEDPPLSESLVLEAARELESEFRTVHLENAIRFRNEYLAEMFRDLARGDEQHVAALASYHEERKHSPGHSYH
jgi:rubrerythrin